MVTSVVLKFVEISSVETVFGARFMNTKYAYIICLVIVGVGHPQLLTLTHIDNTTAVRTPHSTIKRNWYHSIETAYFYLLDQASQKTLSLLSTRPGTTSRPSHKDLWITYAHPYMPILLTPAKECKIVWYMQLHLAHGNRVLN